MALFSSPPLINKLLVFDPSNSTDQKVLQDYLDTKLNPNQRLSIEGVATSPREKRKHVQKELDKWEKQWRDIDGKESENGKSA